MNKIFILIYLTTLSITLSSCSSSSSNKEVSSFQESKPSYSSSSENKTKPSSRSQKGDSYYNNYDIKFENIEKVNQENFPKSQLLSIKSDFYYGQPAIHVTSRNGSTRKEIIYDNTLDKKLGSYTHYDKNYDENKKLNLSHIISLEKAIKIASKSINRDFNIDEWKLTFEDDEQAVVWELESEEFEVQLNAQTGEVYDVDS